MVLLFNYSDNIYRGGYIERKIQCRYSLLIASAVLYIVYVSVILLISGVVIPYSFTWWIVYISPLRSVEFTIGMLCGMYYAKRKKHKWKNSIIQCVVYTIIEVLVIIVIINVQRYFTTESSFGIAACWTIPSLMLIWICLEGNGVVGKLLSSKQLISLGKLNYPMLCCHQVLFNYLSGCLGGVWWYSKDIGNLIYLRIIFIFILIICISDILKRTFCTW